MNDLIKNIAGEIKRRWYLPMMILLGIVMMLLPIQKADVPTSSDLYKNDTYITEMEMRVKEMLKDVAGAGECVVTITLASGGKKEYVREDGKVLVITDNEGNQSAVVSKENMPEIGGVTIASKGADQLNVRNNIIHSVSTLLGIGTNKICVIMKG